MANINELLNTILNEFIPKSKINKFSKLIAEYGFKPNDFTVIIEEKVNRQKIPIEELREKLFTNSNNDNDIILEIENTSDQTELLNKCDEIIKHKDIKNKSTYYHLGSHLKNLKSLYKLQDYSAEEFYNFISNTYRMKKSTICKYIQFNKLCNDVI